MYIDSIDIESGNRVTVGEYIRVDDGDELKGEFVVHSIGIFPNGRGGDVEIRVLIEIPVIRNGVEVSTNFVETSIESCEW